MIQTDQGRLAMLNNSGVTIAKTGNFDAALELFRGAMELCRLHETRRLDIQRSARGQPLPPEPSMEEDHEQQDDCENDTDAAFATNPSVPLEAIFHAEPPITIPGVRTSTITPEQTINPPSSSGPELLLITNMYTITIPAPLEQWGQQPNEVLVGGVREEGENAQIPTTSPVAPLHGHETQRDASYTSTHLNQATSAPTTVVVDPNLLKSVVLFHYGLVTQLLLLQRRHNRPSEIPCEAVTEEQHNSANLMPSLLYHRASAALAQVEDSTLTLHLAIAILNNTAAACNREEDARSCLQQVQQLLWSEEPPAALRSVVLANQATLESWGVDNDANPGAS